MIRVVHYMNNGVMLLIAILSFILLVYSLQNDYEINTWQFPMILAILLDGLFLMEV